jgi:predicted RNase H-like nuclease (RuvC/YqgF family)
MRCVMSSDERFDRLERDVEELRIRMADLAARWDTTNRLVAGLNRRVEEIQRRVDVQLDRFRAEQIDPKQYDALIAEVYKLAVRVEALEQKHAT